MMDINEFNLNQLMEECSEVIKCASKQKRFGPHSTNTNGNERTNAEHLREECLDVIVCMLYIIRAGQMAPIRQADIVAWETSLLPKIERMRNVSRSLGTLEP